MKSWKKILAGKHVLVLVQTKEQHATHLPGGLFQRDNITPVRKQPAPAWELVMLGQGVTHCTPPVNNLGASRGKKTHLRRKKTSSWWHQAQRLGAGSPSPSGCLASAIQTPRSVDCHLFLLRIYLHLFLLCVAGSVLGVLNIDRRLKHIDHS